MNIAIAGPCGVGKSTIGAFFARKSGLAFLDFDELRASEMSRKKSGFSPCSVSKLDLRACLPPILGSLTTEFILDIGGETVFRPNVDNDERREQVVWLKNNYLVSIVVLTATPRILLQRFSASKNRGPTEFDELWTSWKSIGEPYWLSCADLVVDTTGKSAEDSVIEIEMGQKL